jgi:hypothetical protein
MKRVSLTILGLILGAISFAQSPQKFNYQAIVRDAGGVTVTDQLVGVRVSIIEGSTLGPEIFAETHGPTSNSYGLINLQIGTGANGGPALSTIDWSANQYYIKVEIDPTGGTNYTLASTSQLVSVPYALHAATVDNTDDADADPTNELITGAVVNGTDLEITDAGGTTVVDMSSIANDADSDPSNELQTLSKVGQIVTLSNGGGAFTDDVNDADSNPNNELNTSFVLVGTTLQLTDAGGILNADLSSIANDADSDPNNEIQTLNKVGSTVTLSNGGGFFTDEVDDSDADNTNELQTISKVGTTVTLSDGGGFFTDEVDDADSNPANELQTVNKVGNTVTLSNGGGSFTVDDSDADPANEFITGANLSGTDLNIIDGGGVTTVDLSSLSGGGGNPTDELITNAQLSGTDLVITEAGTPWTVDMSSLLGGGDPSSTNELITNATLNGTDLEITDAGATWTVDLSSLGGGGGGPTYAIGEHHEGGIIVWVDSTGDHGIICAYADVPGGPFLFESGANAPIVYGSSDHDGQANTAAMDPSNDYPAAEACIGYSAGGYSDWYLPSIFEMQIILGNPYIITDYGLDYNSQYWTSTEPAPGVFAWGVSGIYGPTYFEQRPETTDSKEVRCFRRF